MMADIHGIFGAGGYFLLGSVTTFCIMYVIGRRDQDKTWKMISE